MKNFSFEIIKKDKGLMRAGIIKTPNGEIRTPAYIPVGTKATVKSITNDQLDSLGAQAMLANTYHLYLEPGDCLIQRAGGLHGFMNYHNPIITDSGGFQVFSLGAAYGSGISKIIKGQEDELQLPTTREEKEKGFGKAKIDEAGVMFRSHIDGSAHYFTPEKSIEIQHNLGADIIFAFDECTSPTESKHYQREALDRTHRWAKKCLDFHKGRTNAKNQMLYAVVQGGRYEDLRKESAQKLSEMETVSEYGSGFDGFGIGGSFDKEDMSSAVRWTNEILPEDKPRHLLGIGEPEDLFMGVENGCDTFDCVAATRIARNGQVYTKDGKINLMNKKFVEEFSPIQKGCACYTCKNHTRAYLAHLFRGKEMLGATLATIHNTHFIVTLVGGMRKSILNDSFEEYKKDFLKKYSKLNSPSL